MGGPDDDGADAEVEVEYQKPEQPSNKAETPGQAAATSAAAAAAAAADAGAEKAAVLAGDGELSGSHRASLDGFTGSLVSARSLGKIDGGAAGEGGPSEAPSSSSAAAAAVASVRVPWLRQLSCLLRKNVALLRRRPLTVLTMSLSSVLFVLLAWAAGRDPGDPPAGRDGERWSLTDCGTVDMDYFYSIENYSDRYGVRVSLNESWRSGAAAGVLAMGPAIAAIGSFLVVHEEISTRMLGVLRGLGARDSAYWTSWLLPLYLVALVNALLGAVAAALVPVHVLRNVHFGGVFSTLFLLQVALVPCSLFLAAVCGTAKKAAVWLVLLMLMAVWVVVMIFGLSSSVIQPDYVYNTHAPVGMFWVNSNTAKAVTSYYYDPETGKSITNVTGYCHEPMVSQEYGTREMTKEQRAAITKDDYFVGCSAVSSYATAVWARPPGGAAEGVGLAAMFLVPYFHFFAAWSNILGYTSMPDRSFASRHMSMSTEDLAVESLPSPPDPSRGNGTALFAQGSTLKTSSWYPPGGWGRYYDPESSSYMQYKNCPLTEDEGGILDTDFCPYLYNCNHGKVPSPTGPSPSVNQDCGYLVALAVIYSLLAAYWAQVFPCGNGAGRRWYFPILPSYWLGGGGGGGGDEKRKGAAADEKEFADEEEAVGAAAAAATGVEVDSVRKLYGNFEALKGVSIRMERGEVTALLGHNGAGKTTLSKILSCDIAPSDGRALVFGRSVAANPDSVRRLVGVCPQDDFLWPTLSARAHLELFAGLRGVPPADVDGVVDRWLESVDLGNVREDDASSYSGGMKRRLSVALATVGDRPLVILDEPTTGMDPVSRRFVWRHIDEIKEGRVVLLTTHAMEEADLLADAVAIVRKGELAAWGTPLELKATHGSALQFSVLVDRADAAATEGAIRERFASRGEKVAVDAGDAGNVTVNIREMGEGDGGVGVEALSDFVAWLESEESGVSEYGFSNSSLEEVFLRVTSEEGTAGTEDDDRDEEERVDVCCQCCCKCCISCCLRGFCRCCCRPKPRLEDDVVNEQDAAEENDGVVDVVGQGEKDIATFKPNIGVRPQVEALLGHLFRRHWTKTASIANYVMFSLFVVVSMMMGYMSACDSPYWGLVIPVALLSMMLVSIISSIYYDRAMGLWYLVRSQGLLGRSYLLGSGLYSFLVQFAYDFVLLSLFFATSLFREPNVCGKDENCSYCKFGDRKTYWYGSNFVNLYEDEYQDERVQLYAYPTAGGYGMIFGAALFFAFTLPGAVLTSSFLPGHKIAIILVLLVTLVCSVMALVLAFKPQDEEYYADCLSAIDPNDACNSTKKFYRSNLTDMSEEFLNCVGTSINSDAGNILCLPPYAAILPQFGLYQTLSATVMSEIKFVSEPPSYVESVLIPNLRGADCSGDTCKFPHNGKLYGQQLGFMFLGAILLLILGVAVAVFVAFPNSAMLDFKSRVARALSCVKNPLSGLGCKKSHRQEPKPEQQEEELEEVSKEREVVREMVAPLLVQPEQDTAESGSDREENHAVLVDHAAIQREQLPPVLMHKLRKVYPSLGGLPPKVALRSLDLHVPKGQVLGFLGKNGAGKTTALKILSASHEASGGVGLVAGYDVGSERLGVFERLGTCPQFDVIWPGHSVMRHLEFFARLKGLPRGRVKAAARSIAAAVGLGAEEVYRRNAGALSGGMRRRLSIAISLIGAPSVILLDEPTTGLDPSTRNSIWGLVNSFATEERAIVITTHMMIEADTLCNRIAIMSRGELRVVGTQQHLKDRFGSGYLLQLNLVRNTAANQESAMAFVRSRLHPGAVLDAKQAKTLHVHLPRDLDLKKVFNALYSPECASEGCINQFLLSQSSLEDVFIALGD